MTHSQFAGEAEITSGTTGADQLGPRSRTRSSEQWRVTPTSRSWIARMRAGMRKDFGWARSAAMYQEVYRRAAALPVLQV